MNELFVILINLYMSFKKVYKNNRKSLLAFLVIVFGWIVFENHLMNVFDEFVLPVFSLMSFNTCSTILFLIIVLSCFGFGVCWILKYKYQISFLSILMLTWGVIIYIKFRFIWGLYIATPDVLWDLGYTDIFVILLSILVILCLYSFFPKKAQRNNKIKFLLDTPINNPESDILDYSESVRALSSDLETIDSELSYSIGLIAPWGTGKTSYLNLLNYYLNKDKLDKFIVVKFNPRHSLSSKNIQEDFFKKLFSELSKYDSRFSSLFINYLKAINIFAESKTLSSFLDLHKNWNKESARDKINNAIRKINKRIVIVIDDFDRLLADEIIEIFKLIDGNASFTNFIFITAYDKRLVNDIIRKKYTNEDMQFSDKFFTLEIQIPLRPYEKIYHYLIGNLLEKSVIDSEKQSIINTHNESGLLKKYISTLRDAKRFYNLFVLQYEKIHNDILFENYFLLSLMKYKYTEEYYILFESKNEYISTDFLKTPTRFFLNEHLPENLKSKDILYLLFSENSNTTPYSINNTNSFYTYFFEKVYNGIPMIEMNTIFSVAFPDAKVFIDRYVLQNKFNYLLTFLDSKDIMEFDDKYKFERFLDLLLYINCTDYNDMGVPYFKLLKCLYEKNRKLILEKYRYSEDKYFEFVSQKLTGNYPYYPSNMTKGIIMGIINNEFSDKIIFTKEYVLNIAKKALNNLIDNDSEIKKLHMELLYSCISTIDQETRIITLDEDACSKIKDLILKNPAGYFEDFVRLGGWSSSSDYNSIACEPFWEQIFGSKDCLNTFIDSLPLTMPKIRLVKNFWKLYQNNNYKPIEFHGQGDVSKKITNNLEDEINALETLLKIERQFNELEHTRTNNPPKNDEIYKRDYNEFLINIKNINLNIHKRISIINKIQSSIENLF